MSLDGTYDDNNVFALILAGKIPANCIYEDDATFAFLDIMPQSTGHSLIISKWSKARNILEIEDRALSEVMATTRKVARALRKALNPDGLQIAQFNGADAGQTVFHLHMHVIPRWTGETRGHGLGFKAREMADKAELAALAEQVRAAFD